LEKCLKKNHILSYLLMGEFYWNGYGLLYGFHNYWKKKKLIFTIFQHIFWVSLHIPIYKWYIFCTLGHSRNWNVLIAKIYK
jgi:hypothetical protein